MWTLTPSRRRDPSDTGGSPTVSTPVTADVLPDIRATAKESHDAQARAADVIAVADVTGSTTDPAPSSTRRAAGPDDPWRPVGSTVLRRPVILAAVAGLVVGAAATTGVVLGTRRPDDATTQAVAAPAVRLDNGSGSLGPWQQMGVSRSTAPVDARAIADPRGVFLLGDSQARRARSQIFGMLAAAKRPVAWDTGNGRPTHGSVDAYIAFAAAKGAPRTLLVLSGTNDVFEPAAFSAQIERLVAAAGPTRQVYWVTPYVNRDPTSAADVANSRRLRADLEAAAQRHPNLHLIRWGSHLEMVPGAERVRLLPDGVHPIPAAAAQLARLIGQALTD